MIQLPKRPPQSPRGMLVLCAVIFVALVGVSIFLSRARAQRRDDSTPTPATTPTTMTTPQTTNDQQSKRCGFPEKTHARAISCDSNGRDGAGLSKRVLKQPSARNLRGGGQRRAP